MNYIRTIEIKIQVYMLGKGDEKANSIDRQPRPIDLFTRRENQR